MASELIELGASELIELGRFNRVRWDSLQGLGEVEERAGGVLGLFRAVDRLEDPISVAKRVQNQRLKPGQKAVAERGRTISRIRRAHLVSRHGKPVRLFGSGEDEESMAQEQVELGRMLGQMSDTRPGLSALLSEGKRLATNPAFVSALGIVSSKIPSVRKYMGMALAGVSRMNVRQPQEISEAFAVASVADPSYMGEIRELSGATRSNVMRALGDARRDLAGAGLGNTYAAAIKYLGGLAAVTSLFQGCGADCGCDDCGCGKGMKGLYQELRGYEEFRAAEKLAEADLVAKAAAIGDGDAAKAAIDSGRPWDIPIVPITIGIGVIGVAVGLWLWLFR
jgi:hypothetical protein